jgi:hypothetical protein
MDEEELARNLGIGARGNLPVPSSPRPYPLGWRAWPWKRIGALAVALVLVLAAIVVLGALASAFIA